MLTLKLNYVILFKKCLYFKNQLSRAATPSHDGEAQVLTSDSVIGFYSMKIAFCRAA